MTPSNEDKEDEGPVTLGDIPEAWRNPLLALFGGTVTPEGLHAALEHDPRVTHVTLLVHDTRGRGAHVRVLRETTDGFAIQPVDDDTWADDTRDERVLWRTLSRRRYGDGSAPARRWEWTLWTLQPGHDDQPEERVAIVRATDPTLHTTDDTEEAEPDG